MSTSFLVKPKFQPRQKVSFLGGTGQIKGCQREADTWIYTIEMSMGERPDFGRVGAETTIVLEEREISSNSV